MCRLIVYKGEDPILLSHLLTRPAHSIINQAFASRLRLDLRRGPINGDGFGVGWYDARPSSSSSSSVEASTAGSWSSTRGHRRGVEAWSDVSSVSPPLLPPTSTLEGEDDAEDDEERRKPCIFNSITPAWNNENLTRLADKIRSPLVFAHVRATTAGALSEQNCHPWSFGRLMWMHNGGIASFSKIKRRLQMSLPEPLFLFPQGSTDSEWAFALFLSFLPQDLLFPPPASSTTSTPPNVASSTDALSSSSLHRPNFHQHISSNGGGSGSKPALSTTSVFTPKVLQAAMLRTIEAINAWTKEVGAEEPSLMNFCVTDGESVVVTRYVSSRTQEAASLFFSSGTSFTESPPASGSYRMAHSSLRPDPIILIASEPLTFERADWLEIPTNTMVVVTPMMNLLQVPIEDEYSSLSADRDDVEAEGGAAYVGHMGEAGNKKRDERFAIESGFGEGLLLAAAGVGGVGGEGLGSLNGAGGGAGGHGAGGANGSGAAGVGGPDRLQKAREVLVG